MVDFKTKIGVSNNRRIGSSGLLLFSLFMALMIFATTHADRAWATDLDAISVVSLDDINGNNASEVATLVRDNVAERSYVYVNDAADGTLINKKQFFTISEPFTPLLLAVVPDIDSSGFPEIAVLGVNTDTTDGITDDTVRVAIKDASTGAGIKTIGFGSDYSSVAMAVVDISGAPAIAVLGVNSTDGTVRVAIKDASTGNQIGNDITFDANYPPVAMAVVDISGAPAIAVLGVNSTDGTVKVFIKDASNGDPVGGGNPQDGELTFDANYPPVAMAVVPDMGSNGVDEIAVLGVNTDGTVRVFIKDASTGAVIKTIGFGSDYSPKAMVVVPDFTGDDQTKNWTTEPEIAVLGVNSTDNTVKVIIRDASTAAWIQTIDFDANYSPVAMAVVPDFTGATTTLFTTADEIALLGIGSLVKIAVKDASTAKLINGFLVPSECSNFNPVSPPTGAKNIVLIYTDDQRWDNLWAEAMPTIEGLKVNGVEFTNAFVTNPWCCPSRATLFSGGFYSHNTGVLSVGAPNGDAWKFFDTTTIATVLQQNGYKTAILGKYMNGYPSIDDPHGSEFYYIPPGWDWFRNTNVWKSQNEGGPDWFDFRAYSGDSCGEHGHGAKTEISEPGVSYVTYYQGGEALNFLNWVEALTDDPPFFLMLSTNAPHDPAHPPEDGGVDNKYSYSDDFTTYLSTFEYRGRGYSENKKSSDPCGSPPFSLLDICDKPWYVGYSATDWGSNATARDDLDTQNENMLKSLWQVDNVFKDIMGKIEGGIIGGVDYGTKMDSQYDTVYIFTSDNGLLWGEHGLTAKQKPYEESIRIPLIIKVPNGGPTAQSTELVAMDLDLPPTILELAGITNTVVGDGKSLAPLVTGSGGWTSRSELFFESFESGQRKNRFPPTWTAIRTFYGNDTWKYVEYVTGEKELYNLTTDPYELDSKHSDTYADTNPAGYSETYGQIMASLKAKLDPLKGLAIKTDNVSGEPGKNLFLPNGKVNTEYIFQFSVWGGTPFSTDSDNTGEHYHWSIDMTTRKCTDADNQDDINNGIYNGLPTGMSDTDLPIGGLLSGTPTTAGTWEACIKVEDSSVSPQNFDENGVGLPQSYVKRFRIVVSP